MRAAASVSDDSRQWARTADRNAVINIAAPRPLPETSAKVRSKRFPSHS
jgi:hypothetical protein